MSTHDTRSNIQRTAFYVRNIYSEVIEDSDPVIIQALRCFDEIRDTETNSMGIRADYMEILLLVHLAKKLKVKTITEYGSGASTVAFFLTSVVHGMRFNSIDYSRIWGVSTEKTVERISQELFARNLKMQVPDFKVVILEKDLEKRQATNSHSFQNTEGHTDFIYLDGSPYKNGKKILDPVMLAEIGANSIVVVDGRPESCIQLLQHLRDKQGNEWKIIRFGFPSNDSVIIHEQNPRFNEIIKTYDGIIASVS